MKIFIATLASQFWLSAAQAPACDYSDDPRLSSDQVPALLKALMAGESVPEIRIRVGTYLQLGEGSRRLLEPHLFMQDSNCDPVSFMDGELLGRAVIPFEEYYRVMAQAIHDDRPQVAKQLFSRVRAAPMSVQEIQELFGQLPYSGTYGLPVRERMQAIFPRFATTLPLDRELADPLDDGRPQDYAMFKLYQVFGGALRLDQGCGPYPLAEQFYRTERVTGLFGERDVLMVRRKPFMHMMRALGQSVTQTDELNYRMNNCY